MNGSQYDKRIETFYHHFGTSVGEAVHGGQYHTEAMEQRYADTKFIIGSKLHVLSCQETVVGYVVMGQHYAFGETGGSTGVLHVYDIVAGYLCL